MKWFYILFGLCLVVGLLFHKNSQYYGPFETKRILTKGMVIQIYEPKPEDFPDDKLWEYYEASRKMGVYIMDSSGRVFFIPGWYPFWLDKNTEIRANWLFEHTHIGDKIKINALVYKNELDTGSIIRIRKIIGFKSKGKRNEL